jgi:hypothetical protein
MGTPETSLETDTKLKRIAWLTARDPHKRFECLMHHFNEASLAACFHGLDGTKAVGIDGTDKARYGKHLNRRSQRKSFTWEQFVRFMEVHPLPAVRIYHTLF